MQCFIQVNIKSKDLFRVKWTYVFLLQTNTVDTVYNSWYYEISADALILRQNYILAYKFNIIIITWKSNLMFNGVEYLKLEAIICKNRCMHPTFLFSLAYFICK